ncbi:alpha/beta-type small acid-soluble spore protein [Clostridium hydrogenum]|uniref:alpha/beta-type small acid-soluble spore protein n=1 Tax=Clostridium hydrogenum TaxID=2855764 RepID=UPI001F324E35|nr:alpha/beta-type small acid-soluble spore protein [Clostridium hydrogenum]
MIIRIVKTTYILFTKEGDILSKNHKILVPGARKGLEKLKEETSEELSEFNSHKDSKHQMLNVGGGMVKKMVESFEKKLK